MADDCIFCSIASGTQETTFVYEDDTVVAFHDIQPKAKVHVLIIPREHLASLNETSADHVSLLGHLTSVAARLAKELDVAEGGYKLVVNTGAHAGQLVPHLHFHLLGGEPVLGVT